MAMTVNGYIAKEDDTTPWSDTIWNAYYDFIKQRGNIVLGRRTYEMMKEINEFEKLGFPTTAVISNQANNQNQKGVILVPSPGKAIEAIRQNGFEEMVVGGGSQTNTIFMKNGLIDEIYLDLEPLLFGKGIKLFADIGKEVKLQLLEMTKLSENIIRLHYKVLK